MEIRRAAVSDAPGIAKVHVDSWKTTYEGIVPEEFLQSLKYTEREKIWEQAIPAGHVWVAADESGKVAGFASAGRERSGSYPGYEGELYAIYILKEYQGTGIGKRLVQAAADWLTEQGMTSMAVLVLEDNPAVSFYEALGGEYLTDEQAEIGGKQMNERVYGWREIGPHTFGKNVKKTDGGNRYDQP